LAILPKLLQKIANLQNINFETDKPVGIQNRIVDNFQLSELGFIPSVSIEEGLLKTYDWYLANVDVIRR
jgi:hypothetical protein